MVYEGISSIYDNAKGTSNDESEILKNFQGFLKEITKWNDQKKMTETNRILSCSKCFEWLDILIKAVIKANIVLLSATRRENALNDKSYYQNLNINDFIHRVYLECARTFFNNPFLFYHVYQPIDIKRNQRDSLNLIKECIKEAIRKTLPIKKILENYLNEDINIPQSKKDSEIIENTIKKFLENKQNNTVNSEKDKDKNISLKFTDKNKINDDVVDSDSDKFILNMINESKLPINDESLKNTDKQSTEVKSNKKISSEKKSTDKNKKEKKNESETSLSYSGGQWGDDNFEAVFSNTNTNPIHVNVAKKNTKSQFFLS